MGQIRVLACVAVVTVTVLLMPASAWNIPGHMLSGAIAYQVLQQESPQTIDKVKTLLAKHLWYANQWQARVQDVSAGDCSLKDKGDLDDALRYTQRALAINEKVYGPDHPTVATIANNIGQILQDKGDLDGALHNTERALKILEKNYGAENPQTKIVTKNLQSIKNQSKGQSLSKD